MLKPIIRLYFLLLDIVVVLCLAGMVVMVFGNVVLRYGFNSGITQSEELSRWLFVWMVFCGAVIVLREGGHIAVDFLVRAMPRLLRNLVVLATTGVMIWLTVLVIQGAWVQVDVNRRSFAPASGLQLSWFFAAGLVFGVSTLGILLVWFWHDLRALAGRVPGRLDTQDPRREDRP